MKTVRLYPLSESTEKPVKYAVIAARYQDKWIFCRHKDRMTWEIPGGHREPGEAPEDCARRELREETGALEADIVPVCYYSFSDLGMLYFAEVHTLGPIPESSEIAEISLLDDLPAELTYPHIQPHLFRRVRNLP